MTLQIISIRVSHSVSMTITIINTGQVIFTCLTPAQGWPYAGLREPHWYLSLQSPALARSPLLSLLTTARSELPSGPAQCQIRAQSLPRTIGLCSTEYALCHLVSRSVPLNISGIRHNANAWYDMVSTSPSPLLIIDQSSYPHSTHIIIKENAVIHSFSCIPNEFD